MNRFCQYPDCADFTLSENEEVQLVIRRHWIIDYLILSQWIFWGPFLMLLTWGGIAYFGVEISDNVLLLIIASKLLYLIFLTFHFYISWLNETFDVIFLTNDRVLDITQVDFWHRNIIETRLDHVQDATGDIKGFLNTMFDWGSIKIRTANDIADFSIDTVQGAHQKAREVFRLANKARKKEIAGVSDIKEGDFCPVDFSHLSKKKPEKTQIKHPVKQQKQKTYSNVSSLKKSEISEEKSNYQDIKKIFRRELNGIFQKK